MVKIKEYKIQKHGARGITLTLPRIWCDDLGLTPGGKLEVYRDMDDRLIIVPKEKPLQHNNDQAADLRDMMEGRK
jgi:bifunctional DNA-binding transcriptional regulator/antitoxin component of YhaV-PrlF toxin-antitoxin module